MKQLVELIPVILFFVVYQMDGETVTLGEFSHTIDGIFSATGVLIATSLIQLVAFWIIDRRLEKRMLWTTAAVVVFGGATLMLRDEMFIKWKPSVFNWGMAIAFAASQFFGERNLLERIMGSQLALPAAIWSRLCWIWIAHFTTVGVLNLYVAYGYEESTWVSYKLYSAFGFTLFIMLVTVMVISPHVKATEPGKDTVESELRP